MMSLTFCRRALSLLSRRQVLLATSRARAAPPAPHFAPSVRRLGCSSQRPQTQGSDRQDGSSSSGPRSLRAEERDPKDRTREIPVELSMRYLESPAYRETYGDSKIWELYRRNFHKGKTWRPTRRSCIYGGRIITGNPCPICRDEYLVVDYRNVRLISQFINMYNGEILDRDKTGVCQKQWLQIRVALEKAKDHGYLDLDPPFVEYDYDKYRPKERKAEET